MLLLQNKSISWSMNQSIFQADKQS